MATLAGIAVAWGFDVAATTMGAASRLALFVGRFHPLVVHLPIGMLVLVAGLELSTMASKGRIDAAPVLPAVLPIAFLSGGKNGPTVVPGDPAKSAVLDRIRRPIADEGTCRRPASRSLRTPTSKFFAHGSTAARTRRRR